MDEWLDINIDDLNYEYNKGTTIISTKGCDMIGESNSLTLDDIDLYNPYQNKNICFLRDKVYCMNYSLGHHTCKPFGVIKYSNKIYNLKHMNYLGLLYITDKILKRYNRSLSMQKLKMSIHYTNDINKIKENYLNLLLESNCLYPNIAK